MRRLKGCWRLLRVLAHILGGLWIVAMRLPRLPQAQQNARVQVWAVELLGHLGITLEVRGQPPVTGPVLLLANHISWLDIPVMHAARHCRFVSKSDVRDWPLVGTLATAAGTLYIERSSRRDALRMVHLMEEALRENEVLAVFPEGTTGDGCSLLLSRQRVEWLVHGHVCWFWVIRHAVQRNNTAHFCGCRLSHRQRHQPGMQSARLAAHPGAQRATVQHLLGVHCVQSGVCDVSRRQLRLFQLCRRRLQF